MTINFGGYVMIFTLITAGMAIGAYWNNRLWLKKMKEENHE